MLLLPILLPALTAVCAKRRPEKRLLIPLMAIELALVLACCFCAGSLRIPCLPGMPLELRLDGVGRIFSVLFAAMFLLSGIFGFEYLHERVGEYYVFFLLTLSAMLGLCYAGNLLTFYMFYEAMTLLSFPLVLHEGTEASRRAAMKYLGYSLFGAALALFGFFVMYRSTGGARFTPGGALSGPATPLLLAAALAMIVGFGGKAGMMPLHDWLPKAHPEAPAPASAVLSGVITKGGVLGILRTVYYLVGAQALRGTYVQLAVLVLALATVFTGSMLAYKEKVLKKRLAYSTVSQVSYVVFGLLLLNTAGFAGAILQAVFHSVAKVCLFLCAGAFICKTGKTRVEQLYGIGRSMPLPLFCFAVTGLSLVGIPPFAGFVSKWYLAEGSLAAFPALGWIGAAVLLISALLTAGYLLSPVSKGFFPGEEFEYESVQCGWCFCLPLCVLAAAALLLGLFPTQLLGWISGLTAGLL
ncbi:MAG: proton-conducting membrane transporter [Oscillospiraceae bacterium]|nr:proton-conducting membrane transporter [Oscillospiraceae bacterium]